MDQMSGPTPYAAPPPATNEISTPNSDPKCELHFHNFEIFLSTYRQKWKAAKIGDQEIDSQKT